MNALKAPKNKTKNKINKSTITLLSKTLMSNIVSAGKLLDKKKSVFGGLPK